MKPFRFHISIEHIWGLTALVGIFIFINTHPIRPHDFWWHITIGREILSTGKIPAVDIYSYTANGQEYPSYQMFWLMEVVLYSIYNFGGAPLVIFIHSIVISSAYVILFWICKQTSKSWRIAAFGVLFAAALGLNDWNVRPQGITFFLASLYLLAIYKFQENHKTRFLFVFPVGMLIWVNSHGTFIIGLLLIGLWFGQVVWDVISMYRVNKYSNWMELLFIPTLTCFFTILICIINPRGLGVLSYLKTLVGNSVVRNFVTEWAPPTINSLMGGIFFIGLAGSIAIIIFSPKRPNFFQFSSMVLFGLLGLKTSRGSVWFGFVMAPILSEHLSLIIKKFQKENLLYKRNEGSRIINLFFLLILGIMAIVTLPWFKEKLPFPQAKAGLISSETPVEATHALLKDAPAGQLFNAISFGSYLIWSAYPQYQVFVDSRIELFPINVWVDYLNISNAVGDWGAKLDHYGVNTLMLSPVEQPALIKAVQRTGKWELIYKDNAALLFARK